MQVFHGFTQNEPTQREGSAHFLTFQPHFWQMNSKIRVFPCNQWLNP